MSPELVSSNQRDLVAANAVPFPDFDVRPSQTSDFNYLLLRQFGAVILLPSENRRIALAAFPSHIGIIVCDCTQEEMGGIDTSSYVAPMKDTEAVRNWAGVQDPREPMGADCLTSKHDFPISGGAAITNPKPASGSFASIDLLPETLDRIAVVVICTAEGTISAVHLPKEFGTATLTDLAMLLSSHDDLLGVVIGQGSGSGLQPDRTPILASRMN